VGKTHVLGVEHHVEVPSARMLRLKFPAPVRASWSAGP
jgi:hypothetical protein